MSAIYLQLFLISSFPTLSQSSLFTSHISSTLPICYLTYFSYISPILIFPHITHAFFFAPHHHTSPPNRGWEEWVGRSEDIHCLFCKCKYSTMERVYNHMKVINLTLIEWIPVIYIFIYLLIFPMEGWQEIIYLC